MIKKLKSNIVKSIKNKRINVFFLFLLMAFLILIFSKLSKDYTNTVVFNIHKVNVPKDHVILNDTSAELKITLKTIGFKWLKYYFSKPEITIDFKKDVSESRSQYILNKATVLSKSETEFGSQVEVLNISPDNLYFKYDVNMVKKIPVVVNADISFSLGYDTFDQYKTSPDSVQVIGPQVLVENINNIQTQKITLENVKTDISKQVSLELPKNNKDLTYTTQDVTLKVNVEKFTEGTIKVPVHIINVPSNLKLKYFPKTINVIYYTSLKNFNDISAKDFEVVCDFKKASNNQTFLLPDLSKVTNKVKNAKISQQHIDFIITE